MRSLLLLTLALFAARPAQDPESVPDRIAKRVREQLDAEFASLRDRVRDLVREELARKGQDAPPESKSAEPPPARATGPAAPSIDDAAARLTQDSIREIVTFLASDELEGRCAGYPGNDKATEYIAGVYKKAGLKPVGDKGDDGQPSYYQHFEVAGRKTRNTVALLEGADEKLKSEIVVIGGHHDHLGKGNQGPAMQKLGGAGKGDNIWNGADDNGSGSSTVTAIARAFGESGIRPRRSILFMTFSGEEWGLLGSSHYTRSPIFPIESHVAMVNLDMVGRNSEKAVDVRGLGTEEGEMFENMLSRAAKKTGLNATPIQEPTVGGGDSDHTPFKNRGIPVMFFFTGLHRDYHQVSDHVDKLAFDNMEKIGRTAMHIVWELATLDERPKFSGRVRGRNPNFEFPRELPPDRPAERRFGFLPDMSFTPEDMTALGLPETEGGIKVSSVGEDGAAAHAGVKPGDVIVSFAGKTLSRPVSKALSELRARLKEVKPKTPVEVQVLRAGERVTLKAEWAE